MKNLQCCLPLIILCLLASSVQAQNKPAVFSKYASRIPVPETSLKSCASLAEGSNVNLQLGDLNIAGAVISNQQRYENLRVIIIRCSEYGRALVQISEIRNASGTTYAGRILNPDAADGYEIKKDGNNGYLLQKFETGKIFEPCN